MHFSSDGSRCSYSFHPQAHELARKCIKKFPSEVYFRYILATQNPDNEETVKTADEVRLFAGDGLAHRDSLIQKLIFSILAGAQAQPDGLDSTRLARESSPRLRHHR